MMWNYLANALHSSISPSHWLLCVLRNMQTVSHSFPLHFHSISEKSECAYERFLHEPSNLHFFSGHQVQWKRTATNKNQPVSKKCKLVVKFIIISHEIKYLPWASFMRNNYFELWTIAEWSVDNNGLIKSISGGREFIRLISIEPFDNSFSLVIYQLFSACTHACMVIYNNQCRYNGVMFWISQTKKHCQRSFCKWSCGWTMQATISCTQTHSVIAIENASNGKMSENKRNSMENNK